MKKVISNLPDAMPTTTLDKINDRCVYLAVGKESHSKSRWILRYEPVGGVCSDYGWIFRYLDSSAAMSGHFPTAREAIERALHFGDVYEFSTYQEMIDFLKTL